MFERYRRGVQGSGGFVCMVVLSGKLCAPDGITHDGGNLQAGRMVVRNIKDSQWDSLLIPTGARDRGSAGAAEHLCQVQKSDSCRGTAAAAQYPAGGSVPLLSSPPDAQLAGKYELHIKVQNKPVGLGDLLLLVLAMQQ